VGELVAGWREGILSRNPRRLFALAALGLGLGFAWWSSRPKGPHVQVAFLLTHLELPLPGMVLDRGRLVQFSWQSPTPDRALHRQVRDFPVGGAPEAVPVVAIDLPPGATMLEIGCKFALLDGALPVRTRGRVHIDPGREAPQTVDIESCGEVVR
jgi:hypothetical protein